MAQQGKRLPDETRAAVIASLLEGQAVSKIAVQYKLSKGTVSKLKKAIPLEHFEQLQNKKDLDIADQIAKFLNASFEAMLNVLAVTKNDAWLSQQPASELATFNGVTADKVFRILEAIEAANAKAAEPENT